MSEVHANLHLSGPTSVRGSPGRCLLVWINSRYSSRFTDTPCLPTAVFHAGPLSFATLPTGAKFAMIVLSDLMVQLYPDFSLPREAGRLCFAATLLVRTPLRRVFTPTHS